MTREYTSVTLQFEPSGIRVSVPSGTKIMDAARMAGVSIPAFCGGRSSCGKCKVRLLPSSGSPVSEITDTEQTFLTDRERLEGIRLACETKVYGDCKILCEQPGQAEESVILTSLEKDPLAAEPADSDPANLGAAVDIGTTTMAAYLYNMETKKLLSSAAAMNPQIPYGDDVISRISFCSEGQENLLKLKCLIRQSLSELLESLCQKVNADVSHIFETVLVGNTVMTHILLGVSPACLGHAPFTPQIKDSLLLAPAELDLPVNPEGRVFILPAADGFIGADHLAALLKAEPDQYPGTTLVIDIGTNSEICLYSEGNYYCTSCATGPALEGAMIRCGMHASTGAIDHLSIDPVSLEAKLHVIGQKEGLLPSTVKGICGSGIIDAVASMSAVGILDMDGSFSSHAESPCIRTASDGEKEYVLYNTEDPDAPSIVITQQDVRNVQLAKAALYAGIRLLLQKSGCSRPDRILLAGAFGNYIDIKNALKLGMFPDCDPSIVTAIGNAAGAGAVKALLDPESRKKTDRISREIIFIESAGDAAFPGLYADAMLLPHRRDSFCISRPVTWSCPGEDHTLLPQEVFELPFSILEDSEDLLSALSLLKEQKNGSPLILPLVQNLEACCLGAPLAKMKDYWAPGAYPFRTLEEAEAMALDFTKDAKIQALLSCIAQIRTMGGDIPVIELEAPFTILAALLEPRILYAAARKEPLRLEALLKGIADAECRYIDLLIRSGAEILSLADPMGSSNITGAKTYRSLICPSEVYLLKKCRRYLKKGLLHLCGHMAADLISAGSAMPHAVRLQAEKTYMDNLRSLGKDPKIRIMGPGCIRTQYPGQSMGTVLEILT